MVILCESKNRAGQRQLNCMLGPCWPWLCCITFPMIGGLSFGIGTIMWPICPPALRASYVFVALLCLSALACTACSNPGIVRRHFNPPPGEEGKSWRFKDQVQSYTPPGGFVSLDAGVVFEGFDHVCPWTGTAIAGRNLKFFQCWLASLVLLIISIAGTMMYTDSHKPRGYWTPTDPDTNVRTQYGNNYASGGGGSHYQTRPTHYNYGASAAAYGNQQQHQHQQGHTATAQQRSPYYRQPVKAPHTTATATADGFD